jgi:hypothetical protein
MTNSRSEALAECAREVLRQAREQQKREDVANGRVNLTMQDNDAIIRAMLAFTEPAAAMPAVPSRERVAEIIAAKVSGPTFARGSDMAAAHWLDQLSAADAILALIPSHSGETGEDGFVRTKDLGVMARALERQGDVNAARMMIQAGKEIIRLRAKARAALTPNDGGRDDASNEQREEG